MSRNLPLAILSYMDYRRLLDEEINTVSQYYEIPSMNIMDSSQKPRIDHLSYLQLYTSRLLIVKIELQIVWNIFKIINI